MDILLHGATNAVTIGTNSVWQLLTSTNLADTNAWAVLEIKVDDGTTNTLHFGPFSALNPPASFYRAELLTNLFFVVATNLHYPTVIDYHPTNRSLIISYNPPYDSTNVFGIIDENAFLTNWSDLASIPSGAGGYTLRFATAKTTANGFTNGDLFFGVNIAEVAQAQIGWLSPDATRSDTNWLFLPNDNNQPTGLYIDQTGIWSNDLLAVTSDDISHIFAPYNVWRIHSPTDVHLVTSITATHLDGLLTLPDDPRYGPWEGKLLTADPNLGEIYAVAPDGTCTTNHLYLTNSLGVALPVAPDCIRLIETNQSLYCVGYQGDTSLLLKIPAAFFNQWRGDILMKQSGFVAGERLLYILHWNTTTSSFEVHGIDFRDYWPWVYAEYLPGVAFAPIDMPPVQ